MFDKLFSKMRPADRVSFLPAIADTHRATARTAIIARRYTLFDADQDGTAIFLLGTAPLLLATIRKVMDDTPGAATLIVEALAEAGPDHRAELTGAPKDGQLKAWP